MVISSYIMACVSCSPKRHPLLSTLAKVMVKQNESPGSGLNKGRAGFSGESRTQTFYSRSRPTAGTRFHLRALSAECGRLQPRKKGRRHRRRRHPGAGEGEARTIALTISFPAAAAAAGTAAACSGLTGLRVGLRGRRSSQALGSHREEGKEKEENNARSRNEWN